MKKMGLFFSFVLASFLFAEESTDVFGFQKFYKSKSGMQEWNSLHWANGSERTFKNWSGDTEDNTQWTDDRSSDGGGFYVDGNGTMQMLANNPRFHINSLQSWASVKQEFLNTEYTAYFKRDALGGENYGGMVVGVRSGPLGHASGGGNNCDANTYYARFRNDGKWDFEKEWKHPGSYYRSSSGIGAQDPLWGGNVLPVGKWIGMKYIVYNKDASTVRLELYIDSTSNATPPGKWELVGVAEDAGKDWSGASYGAATIEGCADYNGLVNAYAAILKGGIVLMRSDNDHPYYKYVSVREIEPTQKFENENSGAGGNEQTPESDSGETEKEEIPEGGSGEEIPNSLEKPVLKFLNVQQKGSALYISGVEKADVAVFDLQGRLLQRKMGISKNISLDAFPKGVYIVQVQALKQVTTLRISLP